MTEIILLLGYIFGFTLLLLYGSFVKGFIVYKFWYWFLLPAFPTVPHISYIHAVGLSLLLVLFHQVDSTKKSIVGNEIVTKPDYGLGLIYPWLVLLMGWVVHLFIR